ncbi:MAG: hypothetical protein R6W90_17835 [Ignavibacteriaceae bacterium]
MVNTKKVLFVTYYWPPSGKASIHWPLKIIKHLPKFGWQPSVLTAKKDIFSHKDESLLKEISNDVKVIKTNSIEPFDLYKKFLGKGKDEILVPSETISMTNKSLAHRVSIWIRMNLFIPDARAGWFFPAINDGKKFLKKNPHNAVISIGPPHTAHLIGMRLSKKYNIPHFPVFIDPWTDIVYYQGFKRSAATKAIDAYLEKKVLNNAKAVIFINQSTQEDYTGKYNFLKDKSHVLYWGYDEEEFSDINFVTSSNEEILVHAGNIFDYQNPKKFWKQLKKEIDGGRNLKIKFIGSVSPGIINEFKENGLLDSTEYLGFLPYNEMLSELAKATYLLVCSTEKRHVPGKLFEYLRTGRPVIAFGDDNEEVKKILKDTNAGMMFGYDESGEEFFEHSDRFNRDINAIKRFNRESIAGELAEIIDI